MSSFWSNENVGWSYLNSEGQSGSLLTMWREEVFEPVCSFKEALLGLKLKSNQQTIYVVNVNSPRSLSIKRSMWNEIIMLKNKLLDGEWFKGGDFNVVTCVKERKESLNFNYGLEMCEFFEFIYDSNLVDVHLKDNKYNCFSGDGLSMSRIYHFLLSYALIHNWGVVSQRIGKRDISYHCPVWIVSNYLD